MIPALLPHLLHIQHFPKTDSHSHPLRYSISLMQAHQPRAHMVMSSERANHWSTQKKDWNQNRLLLLSCKKKEFFPHFLQQGWKQPFSAKKSLPPLKQLNMTLHHRLCYTLCISARSLFKHLTNTLLFTWITAVFWVTISTPDLPSLICLSMLLQC